MAKKISINKKCNGCGLCFESDYVEENEEGMAKIKGTGIISGNDEDEVNSLLMDCPVHAIVLTEYVAKNKQETMDEINNICDSFKLDHPVLSDFKFDADSVEIPLPYDTGNEYDYVYSNEKKAIEAAEEVIRKNMYNNRVGIVQNVISEYLGRYCGGYTEYSETLSNFYYSANQKAQEILLGMAAEIEQYDTDIQISDNLKSIDTRPSLSHNMEVDSIKGALVLSAQRILDEFSGSGYTLRDYALDADTDDMDVLVTGKFGREKEVSMYCYRDIRSAYESIAKDIKSALKCEFPYVIVDRVYQIVCGLIDKYEQDLHKELDSKRKELLQLIG